MIIHLKHIAQINHATDLQLLAQPDPFAFVENVGPATSAQEVDSVEMDASEGMAVSEEERQEVGADVEVTEVEGVQVGVRERREFGRGGE